MKIPAYLKNTFKLQPVVICYSMVAICSKLASRELPSGKYFCPLSYLRECMANVKLLGIVAFMFIVLAIYAVIWQYVIKNAQIAVVYANKSAYLFWTQLAAVLIFAETITVSNVVGIMIIFSGILLANSSSNRGTDHVA